MSVHHAHVSKWWKEATIYQIWPLSYKDSNGDGVGDIPGIISKLDYIKDLGVDVIWLCPFYKSPQFDFGYDISDYQSVHPPYGTLTDIDLLISSCHTRGLKLIFDLVVNHTSHLHPWFQESRSSKTNPKRDWYMWRPAKWVDGERREPCNWRGHFGGSVWEWDEETQEYYLHLFAPEQPDLNWENPEVRQAIYATAIRFWLDKGVDGFRIDTVNMYSKYLDFPDMPITEPNEKYQRAGPYYSNGPRLHEFLKEMNREAFSKYDCVTIGECPNTADFSLVLPFISVQEKELDMVFTFTLADIDHGTSHWNLIANKWTLPQFKYITDEAQKLAIPEHEAWVTNYLENHDHARSVSRYASDEKEWRVVGAKMLATYLLTLSGTSFIYQGEELGMVNMPKSWSIETSYPDVNTINFWREIQSASLHSPSLLEQARAGVQLVARDHSRTPMQWDSSPHAGFTTGKPWTRVNDTYVEINAAQQEKDENSVLAFYRKMLGLRKLHKDLLVYGMFQLCDPAEEHTMTYIKRAKEKEALVVLNFTKESQPFKIPYELKGKPHLLVSSYPEDLSDDLRPFEARVYLCQ